METTFDSIVGAAAAVLVILFAAVCFVQLISPRLKKKITIVKKYITEHKGLNSTHSREVITEHYIIQCKYPDSKHPEKIHTMNCRERSLYNSLKTGKTYIVKAKMLEIVSICCE